MGVQEAEQAPVGCLSGVVQRGASPAVLQAGVAAGCQEQGGHQHCLTAAGHMQRCQAAVALRVHVCAGLHCRHSDFSIFAGAGRDADACKSA